MVVGCCVGGREVEAEADEVLYGVEAGTGVGGRRAVTVKGGRTVTNDTTSAARAPNGNKAWTLRATSGRVQQAQAGCERRIHFSLPIGN